MRPVVCRGDPDQCRRVGGKEYGKIFPAFWRSRFFPEVTRIQLTGKPSGSRGKDDGLRVVAGIEKCGIYTLLSGNLGYPYP